ncbi:MAG TPA: FlgO family outer membrane protein [Dissulfurispiraceae bacterium]|nr:FlgO family outer membrane protein [Dissulfurispiraceae bacterium]
MKMRLFRMFSVSTLRRSLAVLLLGLLFVLSGCFMRYMGSADCTPTLEEILSRVDMKPVFRGMAADLCGEPCNPTGSPNVTVCPSPTFLVTDFVDIHSLQPKKHGIVMGELMRSSLNLACKAKIVQAEFSESFTLSDKGLVAMSRDPKQIRHPEYPYSEYIVGTFSYSGNKLFLFVRKVDVATGRITRMASREITAGCGGLFNAVSVE